MVATITEPKDIHRPVFYNENKVGEHVAKFLGAGNFLKEDDRLTLKDKLQRFDQLHALNKSEFKTLHISLNFHPSEKLSDDKMRAIADDYVEMIGFKDHPYLVYKHEDAAHPHVHIVLTAIREDGTRKDFHNIGKNQSEAARKALEKKYKLVEAGKHQKELSSNQVQTLNVQKLWYGKTETKAGIQQVLEAVLNQYQFASLPELNAILSIYNVRADPGKKGGRVHAHGGLHYHMIDEKGEKVGVPIKGSQFYFKPTLRFLEEKFKACKKTVAAMRHVRSKIDWILVGQPRDLTDFIEKLKDERIRMIAYRNDQGMVYGLSFVDTHNKVVFKASELGKAYSAKNILGQLGYDQMLQKLSPQEVLTVTPAATETNTNPSPEMPGAIYTQQESSGILAELLQAEESHDMTPYELRVDKKKKHTPYKP